MRFLLDMHIAPRTAVFLRGLGHDVIRVVDRLPATAPDQEIVAFAVRENRTILTQDLDFSAIVAITGATKPSVISIRLISANVEAVNKALSRTLPSLEADLDKGIVASLEEDRIRIRHLPIP